MRLPKPNDFIPFNFASLRLSISIFSVVAIIVRSMNHNLHRIDKIIMVDTSLIASFLLICLFFFGFCFLQIFDLDVNIHSSDLI